ncbi:MAG: hypothetical protein HRT58_04385 [Crocinitomicaceae bacterium]|nr:hypothetical protein [Flavobacteriales bacterium]NQZ34874.1 hypothetical protein [Crocinitomicaceae bacterium]
MKLIETKLTKLKEEYEKGQEQLAILNQQTNEISSTLLRISGAILALEELLEEKSKELEK